MASDAEVQSFAPDAAAEREELRVRIAELNAVYRLAEAVAHAESLDRVLAEAVAALLDAIEADRAAVLIADEQGVMRFRAWQGLSDAYRAAVEGHSPWAPDEPDPQAVVVPDVEASELAPELKETILREGIRALAFVPLVHQSRLVGTFMLYRNTAYAFGGDELLLCRTVASHLASSTVRTKAQSALRESRDQLSVILRSVADGITAVRADGTLLFANEAAARLTGFDSTDAMVRASSAERLAPFELLDEDRNPLPVEQLPSRRALQGEESSRVVCWRIRASGEERWSIVRSSPVRDANGRVELAVNIFHDITDRKRAEERAAFLAEAADVLGASLEYEETLRTLARVAVPRFADWCVVTLVDEDGSIRPVALQHADPARAADAEEFARRSPPDPEGRVGVAAVIRSGEPELVTDVPEDLLDAASEGQPELRRRLKEIAPRSVMTVPLRTRGRTLGAVTFLAAESGRRYGPADLADAEDLARRAAAAVDNALLYRAAEAARLRASESLAQLRAVLDQLPIGVLIADAGGHIVLGNAAIERIWRLQLVPGAEIEGRPRFQAWHADGREVELHTWPIARSLARGEVVSGERIHIVRGDGTRGTIETSSLPVHDESGRLLAAVALTTDVTERLRQDDRVRFLARAGDLLNASLDTEETLAAIASLAVPAVAGQCIVDLVQEDGTLRCVAVAHVDAELEALLREMRPAYPPIRPGHPVQRALATGEPQFIPDLDDAAIATMAHDERHAELVHTLENSSGIVAPLIARGRTLGAITLGTVPPQPPFDAADVETAVELARRAGTAVENTLLYRAAESRAHAAQALAFVDDGVFLVDEADTVLLWNPSAEAITGVAAEAAVGRPAAASLAGWDELRRQVPVAPHPQPGGSRATTLPLELGGEERWVSISGVHFHGGTVYAFRDVTDERAVERLKTDFVSTVSHELRTPLAAIYGAALTLRRSDVRLEETQRAGLLEVIANEADRLARIVNDILWASRLDSGAMTIAIESCDAGALARLVFDAAAQYSPDEIELALDLPDSLPPVAADPDKVRQVLTNLLDNAVKYSPDGGRVTLRAEPRDGRLRFTVIDEGLGVPPSEQERIFEKFFRLDPNLTRGVGGTGLGLYICRELVHRMHGWIWVESDGRAGSAFLVELPLAEG